MFPSPNATPVAVKGTPSRERRHRTRRAISGGISPPLVPFLLVVSDAQYSPVRTKQPPVSRVVSCRLYGFHEIIDRLNVVHAAAQVYLSPRTSSYMRSKRGLL